MDLTNKQNNTKPKKDKKILVIGLGEIGYSNAEYMSSIGLRVDGFDISEKAVTRALSDGIIQKKAESFRGYDYYVICISTHLPSDMFTPYLDGLFDVTKRLASEGTPGALVGIDSTIPRGTANKIIEMLGHRLHVAHTPHRYCTTDRDEHGVRQMRVLGACQNCCKEQALQFYNDILRIPTYIVRSVEIAEMCKTVENAHRFLEIAFAEEMKMVCDNIGVDFDDLREAVNTKWNVKMHKALEGIGGHCLPKDTRMVSEINRKYINSSLLVAAQKVDWQYRVLKGNPLPVYADLLEPVVDTVERVNERKKELGLHNANYTQASSHR